MRYRIERILGTGTFGTVAVVVDPQGQRLAAKVMRDEHLANRKAVRRMRDEARLLANLDHPHIVRIHRVDEVDDRPVLFLEYVEGAPLDAVIERFDRGLPAPEACEMVRQAHEALHAAWRTPARDTGLPLRVIHRDIKPGNLILSRDGQLKVLDFGIAHGEVTGKESQTVSMVLGAHGYTAPERLDGEEDRIEGDVYAMGHVLYELLTGGYLRLSLHRPQHEARLKRELEGLELQGGDAVTARRLAKLIWRMLSYAPDDRPDHAQVTAQLSSIMARAQWSPNLPAWALQHVVPMLAAAPADVSSHPDYDAVAFLEAERLTAERDQKRRRSWLPWSF